MSLRGVSLVDCFPNKKQPITCVTAGCILGRLFTQQETTYYPCDCGVYPWSTVYPTRNNLLHVSLRGVSLVNCLPNKKQPITHVTAGCILGRLFTQHETTFYLCHCGVSLVDCLPNKKQPITCVTAGCILGRLFTQQETTYYMCHCGVYPWSTVYPTRNNLLPMSLRGVSLVDCLPNMKQPITCVTAGCILGRLFTQQETTYYLCHCGVYPWSTVYPTRNNLLPVSLRGVSLVDPAASSSLVPSKH